MSGCGFAFLLIVPILLLINSVFTDRHLCCHCHIGQFVHLLAILFQLLVLFILLWSPSYWGHLVIFCFTWSYLNVMILRLELTPNLLNTGQQYSPLIQITLNPPTAAVCRKWPQKKPWLEDVTKICASKCLAVYAAVTPTDGIECIHSVWSLKSEQDMNTDLKTSRDCLPKEVIFSVICSPLYSLLCISHLKELRFA